MLTIIKNNGTEEIVQTEREKINNQTGNNKIPKRLNTLTLCKKLVTEQLNLRKITVAKLAREIGVTRPTLYNLLDDNPPHEISPIIMVKVLRYFGLNPAEYLRGYKTRTRR